MTVDISECGYATVYRVTGLPGKSAVNQAKKYHIGDTDTEFTQLTARLIPDDSDAVKVMVFDPDECSAWSAVPTEGVVGDD